MQGRHGDVWIEACAEIPKDAAPVAASARGFVLAEGEATGHAHTIEAAPGIKLFERDGVLYLKVENESATVTHQEHAARVLEPGTYRVTRQRVWDSANTARTVAD